MAIKKYLSIGKIVGVRGLAGELKVESWCDTPDVFCSIKKFFIEPDTLPLEIVNMRVHKSNVLIKLKAVSSRLEAEALKGKVLYACRCDIPLEENRYFIEELKGCNIVNSSGKILYGILKDVISTGSNDVYVINSLEDKEYLVPIIPGTVLKVDLKKNLIYINPVRGIFDDN